MLSREEITMLAARLDEAERNGVQLRQFSLQYPQIAIEDSYAIQTAWVEQKVRAGDAVRGRKVGLTSKAMQLSSNISEPDYGVLLHSMFFASGATLPVKRFIVPRVEVELAFVLARPLCGPGVTQADVLAATDYITPALEIIDARIEQVDPATAATRKVFDTIADNAANAGVVVGERRIAPASVDLAWIASVMRRNGDVEETGVAAGVLGHPANGVAWIANKFGEYGVGLAAGDFILSGSFTRPVAARAGDIFAVDYGPLGVVRCQF